MQSREIFYFWTIWRAIYFRTNIFVTLSLYNSIVSQSSLLLKYHIILYTHIQAVHNSSIFSGHAYNESPSFWCLVIKLVKDLGYDALCYTAV